VGLEEHGATQARLDGDDGGVEALKVADLHDAIIFFCKSDDFIGLCKGCGQGLFDEQVEAAREQFAGHGVVMDGGHGNVGGLEVETGGEQRIRRREDGDGVLFGDLGGACWVGLKRGGKDNAGVGRFQLAVNAEMVATEGTGTGDCDTDWLGRVYCASPWPSTALRQRE
jgi:hypothetical protein